MDFISCLALRWAIFMTLNKLLKLLEPQFPHLWNKCNSTYHGGSSEFSVRCSVQFSSVQSLSRVRFFVTPGLLVRHQLPESTQTHVHQVDDVIQPSHPLLSPSPVLNLPQHQGLFLWDRSSHQVAKGLDLKLQHQSFQWIFRTDLL